MPGSHWRGRKQTRFVYLSPSPRILGVLMRKGARPAGGPAHATNPLVSRLQTRAAQASSGNFGGKVGSGPGSQIRCDGV